VSNALTADELESAIIHVDVHSEDCGVDAITVVLDAARRELARMREAEGPQLAPQLSDEMWDLVEMNPGAAIARTAPCTPMRAQVVAAALGMVKRPPKPAPPLEAIAMLRRHVELASSPLPTDADLRAVEAITTLESELTARTAETEEQAAERRGSQPAAIALDERSATVKRALAKLGAAGEAARLAFFEIEMNANEWRELASGLSEVALRATQNEGAAELSMPQRVELWDAINDYAIACGGRPDKHRASIARQNTVAAVESVIRAALAKTKVGE
jgi:hypothetical protein